MYTSQRTLQSTLAHQSVDSESPAPPDFPPLLDPSILQAARQAYRFYYEVSPDQTQRPLGVVINRLTFRGQLVFKQKPILLPQESFIPVNQLES